MNTLQQFQNDEFGSLEILLIDEKPHFPATECAKILGYKDTINAIKQHCKGVVKHHLLTKGGKQNVNFIPEGDLYRLIIRSKLPAAERFEHWVFDEVLPSIRKHGAYINDNVLRAALADAEYGRKLFSNLLAEQIKRGDALENHVNALVPKARYYDTVMQSKNVVPVSVIAKDYGISAAAFNNLLHELGIQYKVGGTWVLYQKYVGYGYTKTRTYHVNDYISAVHTYWTQKGRIFLYEKMQACGIAPVVEGGNCACGF